MSAIAFVGDSFCASYSEKYWSIRGCGDWQYATTSPTYIDRVTQALDYDLYPYGFGGKSWWYSRQQLVNELIKTPTLFQQIKIIIFCHTDSSRINNSWNKALDNSDSSTVEVQDFYRHIFDSDFNSWAQEQWFYEIKRRWSNIKTIHFHSFPETVNLSHLLPGIVFTTPLIHVSIGELKGTDADIHNQIVNDKRFNHLSAVNNQVLGDIILENLNNYCPGIKELDLERFTLINSNSTQWPDSGFGTE